MNGALVALVEELYFISQHPQSSSQPSVTPAVLRDDIFLWFSKTPGMHTVPRTYVQALTHAH